MREQSALESGSVRETENARATMLKIKNTLARTLIWLAAISVALQSLPTTCACSDCTAFVETGPGNRNCCCAAAKVREGRCCCCRRKASAGTCQGVDARHSCCKSRHAKPASGCSCGLNCQCGKSKQPPTTPVPVENTSPTEKVNKDTLSVAYVATASQAGVRTHNDGVANAIPAIGALDRCVNLGRFTL